MRRTKSFYKEAEDMTFTNESEETKRSFFSHQTEALYSKPDIT